MDKGTRSLTRAALSAALSVIFLYLASIIPSGRISLLALAGLVPALAVIHSGIPWALGVYAATSVVAALIVPTKGVVLGYIMLFGHYPVLKSLFERAPSRVLEWLLKLAAFNFLLTVLLFAFRKLFLESVGMADAVVWAVYLIGNAAFVVYDIAFSKLIILYNTKWRKK